MKDFVHKSLASKANPQPASVIPEPLASEAVEREEGPIHPQDPMLYSGSSSSSGSSANVLSRPSRSAPGPVSGLKIAGPSEVVGGEAPDFSGSSSSSGLSSDGDSRTSKARKRASKRRKWIRQVYAHLDRLDLPDQAEEEDDASWQFNLEKKSPKKLSYPIYKGVSSQLSKINRAVFDPDRAKQKKI